MSDPVQSEPLAIMQLSIDRASGRRRRWSSVVGGIDCAYQLRGIVSLGIESGHFFEGGAGQPPPQRDY